MENHRETYKVEAYELLTELEASLLELEENPEDTELIGRVFRAMHTIKGSGAMFGFDEIAAFTHDVETVFDLVRDGGITVTKGLVDLTLSACDQIRKMVDGAAVDDDEIKHIVDQFKGMIPDNRKSGETGSGETSNQGIETEEEEPDAVTYRIRIKPKPDLFKTGTNPILLLDELRDLGECKVTARTDRIPRLKDLDPEQCYLSWDMVLTTGEGFNAIKDVFIFVEDECDLSIDIIDENVGSDDEVASKKLGEILVDRGEISPEKLNQVLEGQKRIGEMLIEAEAVDRDAVTSALVEQEHVKETRKKHQEKTVASSIRVAAEKLDTLVDLVGELVIAQARLTQKANLDLDAELVSIAEEVERLTGELRDNTMNIRMLPIGTTFSKFKRLVRDLSNELGKEIVLETEGGETELDKTVIERLNDPLVHIIRNSIDHGIEPPDVREGIGKPRHGTVRLSAFHSGANVVIQIRDDGAGLDRGAIRTKAVEKGIMSSDADLSDKEIFSMIFTPGFSTAKEVTGVSGRGVGMDVVKKGIEALRGSIEIESGKGDGTIITLKLPLTLAIIDGLMVNIGDGYYVMPLSAVEECIELDRQEEEKGNGRHMVNLRDEIVPYLRLRDMFGVNNTLPDIEQIVIAEVNGERIGFVVDHVMGEYQTVIKSLGSLYRNIEGVSGATILGDGTVALILELPKLVDIAALEERKSEMLLQ